ncbi:MAG: GntR family transcriptional regulator [Roseburia sp.]|nr:GntR family transcriptional regulator [Roseburia sp.]
MDLIINNSSMQPIYEQIVGQMKEHIMKGQLRQEEMLPSVRTLSKELRISALTVKKAYDALEQEGFIVTVHGKGSFVTAMNRNLLLEEQRREVEAAFESAVRKARSSGMTEDDIRALFEIIMEG